MRYFSLTTLTLALIVSGGAVWAQTDTNEPEPEGVVGTNEATEVEETVASPEDAAAPDPALDVRTGADGEVESVVMLADVLFSFGDATLEPDALDILRDVAAKLDGAGEVEITGHTDAVGEEEYNLALGQRRATAVRDWLVENTALTSEMISARGVGETDPVASNVNEDGSDNPEGRALNRRVEFTLSGDS